MPIAAFSERVIAIPSICHDYRPRLDRSLNKPTERTRCPIRDNLHPKSPGVSSVPTWYAFDVLGFPLPHFDGADNEHLIMNTAAFPACPAANPGLINLDMIFLTTANAVAVGTDHTGPQLVKNLERRFIPLNAELSLELNRRDACGIRSSKVCRPEPDRQRGARVLHDGTGGQPVVFLAFPAAEDGRPIGETPWFARFAAPAADETVAPADGL